MNEYDDALQRKNVVIERLDKQIFTLVAENTELNTKSTKLKSEKAELERNRIKLEQEIATLKKENDIIENEKDKLSKELVKFENKKAKLESEITKYDEKREKLDTEKSSLREKKDEFERKCDEEEIKLTNKKAKLKDEKAKLERERADLTKRKLEYESLRPKEQEKEIHLAKESNKILNGPEAISPQKYAKDLANQSSVVDACIENYEMDEKENWVSYPEIHKLSGDSSNKNDSVVWNDRSTNKGGIPVSSELSPRNSNTLEHNTPSESSVNHNHVRTVDEVPEEHKLNVGSKIVIIDSMELSPEPPFPSTVNILKNRIKKSVSIPGDFYSARRPKDVPTWDSLVKQDRCVDDSMQQILKQRAFDDLSDLFNIIKDRIEPLPFNNETIWKNAVEYLQGILNKLMTLPRGISLALKGTSMRDYLNDLDKIWADKVKVTKSGYDPASQYCADIVDCLYANLQTKCQAHYNDTVLAIFFQTSKIYVSS